MARKEASREQVATMSLAIDLFRKSPATIVGFMDQENGEMLIAVRDDNGLSHARFGRDGQIVGDWS